jgi:pSer/pThr/pTyr-binding forkhead associated (FHA) protein
MDILLSIRSKSDSSSREVKCTIAEGLVIGRGVDKGVLLEGPDLSREHLVITAEGDDLFITDLSSNGTWLNGNRLTRTERSRVREGDQIEIPGYLLTFTVADKPEKSPAAPVLQMQPPAEDLRSTPVYSSPPSKPGLLAPVFSFLGSFTLLEKFSVLVGVAGLVLLFAYFGS